MNQSTARLRWTVRLAALAAAALVIPACSAEDDAAPDDENTSDEVTVSQLRSVLQAGLQRCTGAFDGKQIGNTGGIKLFDYANNDFQQAWPASAATMKMVGTFGRNADNDLALFRSAEAQTELKAVEDGLVAFIGRRTMTSENKLVVTACVVHEIRVFMETRLGEGHYSEYEPLSERNRVVNTEVAGLYKRMLKRVGLSAGTVVGTFKGEGHTWNWVTLDRTAVGVQNATFWIDPQGNPSAGIRGAARPPHADLLKYVVIGKSQYKDIEGIDTGANATTACSKDGGHCVESEAVCDDVAGEVGTASCSGDSRGAVCCTQRRQDCAAAQTKCAADAECCSRSCVQGQCVTACDVGDANTVCRSKAGCTVLGGKATSASCAGSYEGSVCCDLAAR